MDIYNRLTRRLNDADAGVVAVTSIAGHSCIDEFVEVSVLPGIDLLAVVKSAVSALGHRRVGLLGTKGVMSSHFYGAIGDLPAVVPRGDSLDQVHDAYVTVASTARCTEEQRTVFFNAGCALVEEQGAHAVLLAGTDLGLAFDDVDPGFPVFDCCAAHVDAIAAHAFKA